MKKFLPKLYIGLVLLMLLVPGLGMLFFGEAQAAANEVLAPRPRLIGQDGGLNADFLSDFSDYMADRFAFRQEMVTAWAWLNARLLHTSVEDQVILGSEGWLYYAPTEADYMGQGLSGAALQSAARNLALMQEYVQDQGAAFLFTVAPNKNSLYPAHMPASTPAAGGSNAQRLPAFLAGEGVAYANLFVPFRAREEVLYYRTDSHWTDRGAALAADTVLAALGQSSAYFDGPFPLLVEHRGDLYEMLYPAGRETEAGLAMELPYTTERDPNGGDAITIRSHSDRAGNLLCFRDSFGAALYPYLAASFGQALFSRQADYDLTQLAELQAGTVVIELVERNIPWLLSHPALYPAPERPAPEALAQGAPLSLSAEAGTSAGTKGLVRLSGALPELDGQPVLLRAGGTWYEAAVTLDEDGRPGFSAWLPQGAAAERDLAIVCGGALCPGTVEE